VTVSSWRTVAAKDGLEAGVFVVPVGYRHLPRHVRDEGTFNDERSLNELGLVWCYTPKRRFVLLQWSDLEAVQ
jgi:hypothetical protein